jgi:hypothetical protein
VLNFDSLTDERARLVAELRDLRRAEKDDSYHADDRAAFRHEASVAAHRIREIDVELRREDALRKGGAR